jgi:hypothetical protein
MLDTTHDVSHHSRFIGLAKRSLGFLYRKAIRGVLPSAGPIRYSGIAIAKDRKWGDMSVPSFMAPYMGQDIPNYEAVLIDGLRANVRQGDNVVVVGGGEGVTVVVAAQAVGSEGSVVCFEGNEDSAKNVRTAAARSRVDAQVTVKNAVVAKDVHVYGALESEKSTKFVAPEDLPPCDVLELDCEGAEIEILSNLAFLPRVILVETHGLHGAPTADVRKILESRGYGVADLGWAEPSRLDDCKNGDIRVLCARKR